MGTRGGAPLFHDRPLARAEVETFRNVFRAPGESNADWNYFAATLDNDFNTPEALDVLHRWRDHDRLREALDVFGLASLAEDKAAPADVIQLAEQRRQARIRREYAESDALREAIETHGWEVRDVDDGYQLVPK